MENIPIPALQRQQRRGHLGLRFAPPLEDRFREQRRDETMTQRLSLLAVAFVLVLSTPMADAWLLQPPPPLLTSFRIAQFGFMLPAVVLAFVITWLPAGRRWADPAFLLAAFALLLGVIYQRHAAAAFDYRVPSEFVAAILAATLLISGLPFRRALPASLVMFALYAAVEHRSFGAGPQVFYGVYGMGMLMVTCIVGAYLVEYQARSHWLGQQMLERLTLNDPLTGLLNSRAFDTLFRRTVAHAMRERRAIALALFDIDFFHEYNERHGYAAGDELLQEIARCVQDEVRRSTDLVARLRGDVLVAVWYGDTRARLVETVDAVRAAVQRLAIAHDSSAVADGVVTVSAGALWLEAGFRARPTEAMRQAEQQLQKAKREGRNCTRIADFRADTD